MALPNLTDLSTAIVTGTYLNFAGAPESGQVVFQPQTFIRRVAGGTLLVPDQITATLNPTTGHFSIELPIGEDADYTPTFTYLVTERIGARELRPPWYLTLHSSQAGTTVDLINVTGSPAPSATLTLISIYGGTP